MIRCDDLRIDCYQHNKVRGLGLPSHSRYPQVRPAPAEAGLLRAVREAWLPRRALPQLAPRLQRGTVGLCGAGQLQAHRQRIPHVSDLCCVLPAFFSGLFRTGLLGQCYFFWTGHGGLKPLFFTFNIYNLIKYMIWVP